MKANKEKTLDRLSRLEGQVRGIAKMVEADRYCMDILAQTAAIRSAVLGVEKLVLDNHAHNGINWRKYCLSKDMQNVWEDQNLTFFND